jgi:hypothetical protein
MTLVRLINNKKLDYWSEIWHIVLNRLLDCFPKYVFTSWVQLMFNKFNPLRPLMFPTREKIKETLPKSFYRLKNIRVLLDCAEIFCETPSNLEHQATAFSNHKAHITFKVLIGKKLSNFCR